MANSTTPFVPSGKILSKMTIYPIHTGNFKLDGGAMFGVVPKGLWERTNPADEKTFVPGPCAHYLLKTEIDSIN